MEYYDATDGSLLVVYEILSSLGFAGAQLIELYYIGSISSVLEKEVQFYCINVDRVVL